MNLCKMCGFWGNQKIAMGSIFYEIWSAQVQARIGKGKDTIDYNHLCDKYPYGICKCPEFIDISNDSTFFDMNPSDKDYDECPQKGLLYQDGEGCGASFVTRENFGCVYWTQRPIGVK